MYSGNTLGTVATFLSLIGSIMVSYVRARAEGLGCECKVGLMQRPERVVLTALGCMLFGLLHGSMGSDSVWFLLVPQLLIAVLSNATAVVRIIHVYKQLR
jgi:CDP-diacylglycerol--glycerol-3-phosphate 3-phosphatidyltransferase